MKIEHIIICDILKYKEDSLRFYLSNNVSAAYFFDDPQSGVIYSYLIEYYRKYGRVPSIKFLKTKFSNFEFVKPRDVKESLFNELRRKYKKAELTSIIKNAAEMIVQNKEDVDEIIVSRILNLKKKIKSGESINSANVDRQFTSYLERATAKDKISKLSFSIDLFDKVTLGIQSNDFGVVLARQKTGKTNFVLWLISNWIKKNLNVLFIPLEGSPDLLEGRLICFYAGLNYWRWRAGLFEMKELTLFEKTLSDIKNGIGKYTILTKQQGLTPTKLLSYIEELNPDITIIDAMHKMKDDENSKQPYDRCSNVSRSISDIVSNKEYPILGTWQINRADPYSPPKLHQASYTDALGQDVTMAIGLFRNNTMKTMNLMQADFLANREDETPGVILNWDLGNNMKISEAPEEYQSYYLEGGESSE